MALATLNYSKVCYVYGIYSGINREVNKDVNKKVFWCSNILKFITWILPQLTARKFFSNQSEASLAKFEILNPKI